MTLLADTAAHPAAALPNWMERHGARLADCGYRPIPIMPGAKCPGRWRSAYGWGAYPDWSRHCDRPTKPFEIGIWKTWPGCGVGIACGNVVALDVDIPDACAVAEILALAREHLGPSPAHRVGNAPKALLVYRAAAPFRPIKRHPIEVLALGNQFVAYHTHPDTGRPYQWPDESLDEIMIACLPAVTEAQCRAFLDRASEFVPPEHRKTRLGPDRSADYYHAHGGNLRGTMAAITDALSFVRNDDLPYDDWIRVGLAIKGALGESGRELFCSWSASSSKDVPSNTLRAWESFRPDRIGAGSLYYYAGQAGWTPDASLILSGEVEAAVAAVDLSVFAMPEPPAVAPGVNEAPLPALVTPAAVEPRASGLPVAASVLAPGGVLADMVQWMTDTAVSPQPLLALGAAICAVGAAAGRRFRTEMDNRTNLYVVGLAGSGSGKDHPRACVKMALMVAGLQGLLGGEDVASGAAVMSAVHASPVSLFLVDEFGHFLRAALDERSASAHRREIVTQLTKLWSSAAGVCRGTEYANRRERPRQDVVEPCVSVYGTTVPQELWSALQAGHLGDGSIARYLFLRTECDYPDRQRPRGSVSDVPAGIVDALRALAQGDPHHPAMVPKTVVIPFAGDCGLAVDALLREQLDRLREHEGGRFAAVHARYAEQALRLALIHALSLGLGIIERASLDWARAVVDLSTATLVAGVEQYLADSRHEADVKKLRTALGGEWISARDLSRRTQWLRRRDREEIIAQLLEAGGIEMRETAPTATGGRPGRMYRVVR